MNISIRKAVVLIQPGTDVVFLFTDLPSPSPPGVSNDNLVLKFEARSGSGEEYVREHLGIEPIVTYTQGR